jgi:hypothetical protein
LPKLLPERGSKLHGGQQIAACDLRQMLGRATSLHVVDKLV